MKKDCGLILLAAGNSSRMGECKFLLPAANGLTFFETILQTFTDFGIGKAVVVSQEKHLPILNSLSEKYDLNTKVVANKHPEYERFYSLQLGIKSLGKVERSFVHNADSPFVDLATLELLYLNRNKAEYLCPVHNGKGGHPILLNEHTLKQLVQSAPDAILKDELRTKKRLNIDTDNKLIFVDIDTPNEYRAYFKR